MLGLFSKKKSEKKPVTPPRSVTRSAVPSTSAPSRGVNYDTSTVIDSLSFSSFDSGGYSCDRGDSSDFGDDD